ncbi:hypothetical protein [Micromonospora sp. NPDC048843]|uniref:ApeA N-terminal domain 1-containing protein n=1 Tax=Micromonospora sp. NPDC048843 TaxID=3155389 RepID=UPI0033FEA6E3
MEDIDENGIFWLPGSPEKTFVGHLKFSAEGGASLVALEGFAVPRQSGDAVPRILGQVRNKKVTLLDSGRFAETVYGAGLAYSRYRPQHLFMGQSFIPEDEPSFTTAHARYHNLPQWVNRTGFIFDRHDSLDEITIRYKQPDALTGQFSRGTVYVDFSWRSDGEDLRERRIVEWPSVRVAYPHPTPPHSAKF